MRSVWPILFGLMCLMQFFFVILAIQRSLPRPSWKSPDDAIVLWTQLDGHTVLWLRLIVFGLSALLPVFTATIMTNNMPDKMIAGRQRRKFNLVVIVSFLLIPFLFGFVFSDYKQTPTLAQVRAMRFGQVSSVLKLCSSTAVLIFHLLILFGLYRLRNFINANARRKLLGFEGTIN